MINKVLANIGLSALLVVCGIYLGYNYASKQAKVEVLEYKNEKNELKEKLKDQEIIVRDRIVVKVVKEKAKEAEVVTKNTTNIETHLVPTGYMTNGWVEAHNAAALGLLAEPNKLGDTSLSAISDKAAADTVSQNYGICRGYLVTIEGWQKWYEDTNDYYTKLASK